MRKLIALLLLVALASTAASAPKGVDLAGRSVLEVAPTLKTGQFVWAPNAASAGPTLLLVNLDTQRAILFRNGVPIAASTLSTGRPGFETPTGVFTILQKHVEHYSSKYDNAPMPYMQRLTWKGSRCMPETCRAIRRHMAAFDCPRNLRACFTASRRLA